ncbi:dihydrolipoyllysine-residue succinyltransferase component of 2-oxoglutarate dehydrogenase complex [Frankia sp. AgKG'84/4]|uniref:hypothetical protein n=1 Tax=Frankia sp. AgKG'84/4 TaxID=573490 RepID=UPI00200D7C0F|nr:hypothetical protein [Frankia sp. AgKG'84/4]MCL9793563.1 hypothetical protein [Frankia sp. AgKG'84/4]
MSNAPTDPSSEQAPDTDQASAPPAPDTHAGTDPEPANPSPDGSAEPASGESASGGRPPLRPVDWDGAFSRTWQSRDRNEVMNRLAAEQEREWSQRELDQMMREFRDTANESADARAREERERAAENSEAVDDARSRLFDKLEGFGRLSGDAVASPDSDRDGSSGPR